MLLRQKVREMSERLVERTLHVKVYREAPYGTDPYPVVRRLRQWRRDDVIFDVGANDGRTVVRLQENFPSPQIFSFEPVASTYAQLVERAAPFPNVRCFPLALGEKPGEQQINLHAIPAMNSFSSQWSEFSGVETVTVSTVDEVMERENVDFIHFLKIDTEGYELEVLKGARKALTDLRIAMILVEVGIDPRVSPHTPIASVLDHFAGYGYALHGIFNQCRSRKRVTRPTRWSDSATPDNYRPGAMAYCDALFVAAEFANNDARA